MQLNTQYDIGQLFALVLGEMLLDSLQLFWQIAMTKLNEKKSRPNKVGQTRK